MMIKAFTLAGLVAAIVIPGTAEAAAFFSVSAGAGAGTPAPIFSKRP
jgi:hypothetical protein